VQVASLFVEVRGEGVPKRVNREAALNLDFTQRLGKPQLNLPGAEPVGPCWVEKAACGSHSWLVGRGDGDKNG